MSKDTLFIEIKVIKIKGGQVEITTEHLPIRDIKSFRPWHDKEDDPLLKAEYKGEKMVIALYAKDKDNKNVTIKVAEAVGSFAKRIGSVPIAG